MFSIQTKVYGEKNHNIVLVFAGWEMRTPQPFLLGQLLASYNFKAIIFTWSKDIFSADASLTLSHFEEIKKTALQTVSDLPKKEQKNIAFFGLGQAGNAALLTASTLKSVNKLILNFVGDDFSEIVWHNLPQNRELKNALHKKNITLPKLKKHWAPLSASTNFEKLNTKDILMYLATEDEIVPFKEQEVLLNELRKKDFEIEAIVNTRHKHNRGTIVNLLRFPIYITFLRKPSTVRHLKKLK